MLEYYLKLRDPSKDSEAERALLTHAFAQLRRQGEIWIVPGGSWKYSARVISLEGEFLLEFDDFALIGERLKPWIADIEALGGFDLVNDDGVIANEKRRRLPG